MAGATDGGHMGHMHSSATHVLRMGHNLAHGPHCGHMLGQMAAHVCPWGNFPNLGHHWGARKTWGSTCSHLGKHFLNMGRVWALRAWQLCHACYHTGRTLVIWAMDRARAAVISNA